MLIQLFSSTCNIAMFNLDGDKDKDPECVLERLEKGDQLRGAWLLTRAMDIIRVLQKYIFSKTYYKGLRHDHQDQCDDDDHGS